MASADFFTTMRIPILEGRGFTADDRAGQPPVTVINTRLARRLWPDESAVGKTLPGVSGPGAPGPTVIGVVGDIHGGSLSDDVEPELFLPLAQSQASLQAWVAMRGRQAGSLITAVRDAVRAIDPEQPIAEIASLQQMIAQDQSARRLNTTLVTFFALLAVALAMIGIYGVTAYAVSQRTREFGVRVALGASPSDVVRLVVRENAGLVGAGIVAGVAIALLTSRILSSLLFGVGRTDIATFAGTAVLLALVAFAATFIPARRATRVDPVVALRTE
jgi:putative ABC transport system permease protein